LVNVLSVVMSFGLASCGCPPPSESDCIEVGSDDDGSNSLLVMSVFRNLNDAGLRTPQQATARHLLAPPLSRSHQRERASLEWWKKMTVVRPPCRTLKQSKMEASEAAWPSLYEKFTSEYTTWGIQQTTRAMG
jgi:hypothetical protein